MAYQPGRSDVPLDEGGGGVDMRVVARLVVAVVAVVLFLLFLVQNNDRVETSFVFFTVDIRLWVSLLVAVAIGVVLGQAGEALWNRRKRRRRTGADS
jgi:uncharacterized integral membrane protein